MGELFFALHPVVRALDAIIPALEWMAHSVDRAGGEIEEPPLIPPEYRGIAYPLGPP